MATLSNSKEVAGFGGFQLDLRSGELRRNGVLVKLQPQPAKVLVLLVKPGWGNRHTERKLPSRFGAPRPLSTSNMD